VTHANAYLSAADLALAQLVDDEHWPLRPATERFQCSPATAKKWADRNRDGGEEAMRDRSSRPHHSPHRTASRTERRIVGLRFTRRWGPHRIGYHLHLARSTVEAVLRRYRTTRLTDLDQRTSRSPATGPPLRTRHTR